MEKGSLDLQAKFTVEPEGRPICPQELCTFIIKCVAPQREGICSAEFGLETAEGERFGDTVQCYISVPKLEEDKQAEESLLLVNREKKVSEARRRSNSRSKSPRRAAAGVQMENPAINALPNPYANLVPQKNEELVTPKQVYVARIQQDAIEDQNLRDGLDRLFDMGFTNYDINLTLMKRYGDFGAAAEHLCVHGEVILPLKK